MRRLPTVSGQEAAKAFEKIGFVYRHTVGSHMIYKRPAGPTLSIPKHRQLDLGLLRRLINDAGISVDKFIALLS